MEKIFGPAKKIRVITPPPQLKDSHRPEPNNLQIILISLYTSKNLNSGDFLRNLSLIFEQLLPSDRKKIGILKVKLFFSPKSRFFLLIVRQKEIII